jgi:hypothetical protein
VSLPRFFIDEDVYAAVAVALRDAGFDALRTPEAQRLGEWDESQFAFAVRERRTIVTFNRSDFVRLHTLWIEGGRTHSGIVVDRQRNVGDTIKRLLRLARTLDAEALVDRLEFLSDW